ncbi:hypothetical protein [Spirosoma litoris]
MTQYEQKQEQLERDFTDIFIKLLTAENEDARKAVLEPLQTKGSVIAKEALELLINKIYRGEKEFEVETKVLYYDYDDKDYDEFRATLTFPAHKVFTSLDQNISYPVTWSLIAKIFTTVSTELKYIKNTIYKRSQYDSLIEKGFFQGDKTQKDEVLDTGENRIATPSTIPSQSTPAVKRINDQTEQSQKTKSQTSTVFRAESSETFADFFRKDGLTQNDLSNYVDILKNFRYDRPILNADGKEKYHWTKPIVNEKGEWIGKKGSIEVLVAWVKRLEVIGRIPKLEDKHLVKLLNNHFPNLDMGADGRSLRGEIKDELLDTFTKLIPA